MKLLEGKTALITGAARGIGKAIALKFAAEGANIAFTDLVIDENGKATEAEIAAFGVQSKGYASNAADFAQTAEVVKQVKEDFGRIDILVNNAGIQIRKWATEFPIEEFKKVIDVNMIAYYVASRAAARYMQKQGGGSLLCLGAVGSELYGCAESGGHSVHNLAQRELGIHLAFGLAHVRHDDQRAAVGQHFLQSGECATDTGVVGYVTVLVQGYIEVHADNCLLTGKVEIFDFHFFYCFLYVNK